MKKLLFTILAVMCCTVTNAQDDVTFTAGGISYKVTGVNTVEVLAVENMLLESIEVPTTVTNPDDSKTYNVTGIGNDAFQQALGATSVTIPEGVTYIGKGVFAFCRLKEDLVIPSTVKSIGDEAFKECRNLPSVTIKGGNIGENAFKGCSGLTSISLQEGVTGIGSKAFDECNSLNGDLVIPSTVKSIGDNAFEKCYGLTSVTIKGGSIGDNAFESCRSLTSISLQEGVTSIGAYAFHNIATSYEVDYLIIPSTVKSIGEGAFNGIYVSKVKVFALVPPELGENALHANTIYVPDVEKYKECDGWREYEYQIKLLTDFRLGDQMYSLDETGNYFEQDLTFIDRDLYVSGRDFTVKGKLNYSRTFEATGVWQAWFVPFDVTVGQMNAAGMEVAQIADVLMGENEQVITAAAKMTNTDAVVKANTPYMVMATKSEVNMKLAGPVIKKFADAEPEEHHITIQSPYNTSKIGGIYHEQSNSDWYALSPDGTFIKINDAVLQAQRLWLTIKPRTDSPYVDPSASEPFIDANELDYFTTPCTDCPTMEVKKGDKTVKLYNPEGVTFKKE